MQYGTVAGIDRPVSRLVMGTMVAHVDTMPITRELMDAFVEAGGNCIDTAYVYGGGKTEVAIGRWMRERGNRARIVMIAKGAHPTATSGPRVTPKAIDDDVKMSLARMQTNYFDLYMLHRDDPDYPVGPIVEALNAQIAAGRIRAFGGSNWSHTRLAEANAYAEARGLIGFAVSSPYCGLADQIDPMWAGCLSVTDEARAWYASVGMPVFEWSSQASGLFTGRWGPEDRSNSDLVRVYYSEANWARVARAQELAAKRGCTPNQIALAWALKQPYPAFALIGPRALPELADSVAALDVELSDEEWSWLRNG
jgi:1-deoxyxylulose-5-phosphate synthase